MQIMRVLGPAEQLHISLIFLVLGLRTNHHLLRTESTNKKRRALQDNP